MTSIAKAIEILARNTEEAETLGEARAIAKDQDWQSEQTLLTFDDNSVLVFSGPSYWAKEGVNA
ncbi:hypothetical protein BH10PSE18_BH10PSE18_50360 [soil metagenome]